MDKKPKYDALLIQDGAITELIAPEGRRGIEYGELKMESEICGDKVVIRLSQTMKINNDLMRYDPSKITGITNLG